MRTFDVEGPCEEWQGRVGSHGYGTVGGGKMAHRKAYEAAIGPIPPGLVIDHLCRNTLCVNPRHLEAVTPQENVRRGLAFKDTCPRGHQYESTRADATSRDGRCRRCLVCHREEERRRKARKRAAS